jgi:hypothetical protein
MNVSKLIALSLAIFVPVLLFISCDKVLDILDTTIKVVKEDVIKKQQQVTAQAGEIADSTKRYAGEQLDKTQQQLLAAVSSVTQQLVTQTKNWIYETLKPFFPWIFIIFFLLLFAALKAIIPFSNIFLIQLPLVVSSYVVSFWLFAKQGLSAFAITGTFWLFIPVVIAGIIVYLFRNFLRPKILDLNSKLVATLACKPTEQTVLS